MSSFVILAALTAVCLPPANGAALPPGAFLRSADHHQPLPAATGHSGPQKLGHDRPEPAVAAGQYWSYEYGLAGQVTAAVDSQETPVESSSRHKRSPQSALDLSLSHTDSNGNDRRVGQLHGGVNARGHRNDRNNYHVDAAAGVGSVVYRSDNGRHSVGVGATVGQSRGRSHGYRYQSRPSYGAGVGYRFRF